MQAPASNEPSQPPRYSSVFDDAKGGQIEIRDVWQSNLAQEARVVGAPGQTGVTLLGQKGQAAGGQGAELGRSGETRAE